MDTLIPDTSLTLASIVTFWSGGLGVVDILEAVCATFECEKAKSLANIMSIVAIKRSIVCRVQSDQARSQECHDGFRGVHLQL